MTAKNMLVHCSLHSARAGGVTASECARVIKAAGGEKVYVVTIAGAGF